MTNKGESLLEMLIIMGLLAIILPVLFMSLISSRSGQPQQKQRFEAVSLMKEAEEAVRVVRDAGWINITNNGTYHPLFNSNTWTLQNNSETINGFIRSIEISSVNRNQSGNIVDSPNGTLDPSTKKVVLTVSWTTPNITSVTSTLYLTRHESIGVTQTTKAQFDGGTLSGTFTANNQGGEVILGAGGGGGDWCIPSNSITEYVLPRNGVANAITATEGRVYIGTGQNSSGVSMADVKLTTNTSPPQVLSSNSFDGYKTNAIFGESFNNGASVFSYLATDTNAKEIVIVDLNQYSNPPTNTKYKEVGSLDLAGNGTGDAIYVVNNKAYAIGDVGGVSKLYIYSLSGDRTSSTLLNTNGYTLSGIGKKILVGSGGTYAYVITSATTNNFEIINISNSANPTRQSIKTIGSNQAGVDISLTSSETVTYAAVAYSASSGAKNIYKIDITNKSNPIIGLGYNTAGMNPTGLTFVTGNRAIVVGSGGSYQYQVLNTDTMDLCNPTSELQYPNGVNGIAAVLQASNGYAYSYINLDEAGTPKLKIILGGAGGEYVSHGTYTSSTINSGSITAFNGFDATVSVPSQTTMGIKIGVASPLNNSCSGVTNFTYLGPNGDPNSSYTISSDLSKIQGTIPFLNVGNYNNPGQCFRYQVTFNTPDPAFSPILYDFTVNYSP